MSYASSKMRGQTSFVHAGDSVEAHRLRNPRGREDRAKLPMVAQHDHDHTSRRELEQLRTVTHELIVRDLYAR